MSTLTVSNVSDGTLSIPTTYVTNGSAKAWVNFNGTGTIAARDSLNVSSLTDNGTGDFTVNFSSAFGAGDYTSSCIAGNDGATGGQRDQVPNASPTASAFRFANYSGSSGLTSKDDDILTCVNHGELA